MTGQFSYLGIQGYNAGTFITAANSGSIRFYAGPTITATTINAAINPLLATATLAATAFVAGVAAVTATAVTASGVPTNAMLCNSAGAPLARFQVAGRAGISDILVNDGTTAGATSEIAQLVAGQTFTIDFRLTTNSGGGGGGGLFDSTIMGDGSAAFPRGVDLDFVLASHTPAMSYTPGDLFVALSAAGTAYLSSPLAGTVSTTVAPAAGGAGALPATPLGYLTVKINGVDRRIAYY